MNYLDNVKRVVVKVGTSTLTYESGSLNIRTIEKLVKVLSDLKNRGLEIVLVSSGAVGVGMGKVGFSKKPDELDKKQALAAIGQCELMNFYDSLFSHYGHTVAQLLLTKDVISDGNRYKNAKSTLENLFAMSAVPIINENDPISTEQLEFGDNDTLSAYVAELVGADLLIILTDIDGLYDKNPRKYPDAKIIDTVYKIDEKIEKCAGGEGSNRGTGGMITKIHAAKIATDAGADMTIASGKNPYILYEIFDGEKKGTLFVSEFKGEKK